MNTLEKMEAWMALSEAKARYCRLLDIKDWSGFASLLSEDFELDLSETAPVGVLKGREEAVKMIRAALEGASTAHQVHNPEMTLNGDEARVIWPMQDRVVWGPEQPSLTGYGHYHERWVKRDGQWKLAALRLTRLHMDMLPPQADR